MIWQAAENVTEHRVQIQRTNNNSQVYTSGWIVCLPPVRERIINATFPA